MPLPSIAWQDLTDDELDTVIRQAASERERRWQATGQRSWLDAIRASLAERSDEDSMGVV